MLVVQENHKDSDMCSLHRQFRQELIGKNKRGSGWKRELCAEIQSEVKYVMMALNGIGGKVMAIENDIRNTFDKWPEVLTQSIGPTLKHKSCLA